MNDDECVQYEDAMAGMDGWAWQTDERTVQLAQALRTVRDTCPGAAGNIAARALAGAEIVDPPDEIPPLTAEEIAWLEERS